jgi:hypothetical protein
MYDISCQSTKPQYGECNKNRKSDRTKHFCHRDPNVSQKDCQQYDNHKQTWFTAGCNQTFLHQNLLRLRLNERPDIRPGIQTHSNNQIDHIGCCNTCHKDQKKLRGVIQPFDITVFRMVLCA